MKVAKGGDLRLLKALLSYQWRLFKQDIIIIFKSMSWCCQSQQPEYKYEVKSLAQNEDGSPQETYKYFNSLEEVDRHAKENENVSITKVKTQLGLNDLQKQIKQQGEKFTDRTFPPGPSSLGSIPGNITWKRIPELLNQQPVLFDSKIEPSDVITGHEGDCYMLSSLAALAEYPDIIRRIFRGQTANPEGLYKVSLRVDGTVEEVLIDDFIPVHENGQPVFCQPNRKTGQIWVVLLEKALAKVSGSYSSLNEGIPSEVFRQVTYAPSESLVFSDESEDKEKVWNLLKEYTANKYPFCATTKAEASTSLGLQQSHTYTVISGVEVEGDQGLARVVKLRNPWKEVNYTGIGAAGDHQFWESIHESQQKALVESVSVNNCSYGLFSMRFEDFCRHFNQIHYCNLNSGGKFLSEELLLSNKACYFDVKVQREGSYTFEINQAKPIQHVPQQQQQEHGQDVLQHAQEALQHSVVEPHRPAFEESNIHSHEPHQHSVQDPQHSHPHEEHPHYQYENVHQHEEPQHQENEHIHNHDEVSHFENLPNHAPEHFHQEPVHSHPPEVAHQPEEHHGVHEAEPKQEDSTYRSTLLLFRKQKTEHGYKYEFVNGTMKYETNTIITDDLTPGEYVIYAKVDPSFQTKKFPSSATLNLYSKNFASLEPVLRTKYPSLVRDALLDHALTHKRSEHSEGKIWMSWQLFFQKGGFAYLAGGNSPNSQQTVVITFNEQDFAQLHFKLKKPLKGHEGTQVLRIPPGEAKIIVARVINDPSVKSVRFPPKLDIKLEAFHP